MTELEHAIIHIKTRADAWAVKEVTEALPSISERLDKALSQEPCDDAISRETALEKMADYVASGYADSAEDFEEYSRIICQLPSVTQKSDEQLYKNGFADGYEQGHKDAEQKSGKWINDKDDMPTCSECGYIPQYDRAIDDYEYSNYCPRCGAKMESEE